MGKSFMPSFGSDGELKDLQLEGLQWTVNHAYTDPGFYKEKLERSFYPQNNNSFFNLLMD